jgi:hypothetical protein
MILRLLIYNVLNWCHFTVYVLYALSVSKCVFIRIYKYTLGTIPLTIGSMSSLSRLHLYFLRLNGTLPTSIGQLRNLKSIFIQYTSLQGTLPSSIGCLTQLSWLKLANSAFSGTFRMKLFAFDKHSGCMRICYIHEEVVVRYAI